MITLINVFTPKPGKLDAFCEAQIAEYRRMSGQTQGSFGANLHRSIDGTKAVNYAQFASVAAYEAWVGSQRFQEHLTIIRPLVDRVEPKLFRVESVTAEGGGRVAVLRSGGPPALLTFGPREANEAHAQLADEHQIMASGRAFTIQLVSLDGALVAEYSQFASSTAYYAWAADGGAEPPESALAIELVYTLHESGTRIAGGAGALR